MWFRLLLLAFYGFILDYFWTHMLVFQNSPAWTYFIVKFVVVIVVSAAAYYSFLRFIKNSPTAAWYVAVPVGILAFVAIVQLYYGIAPIPMSNGAVETQTVQQSFINGYPEHAFDYLFAWILSSITSGLLKLRGTGRTIFP